MNLSFSIRIAEESIKTQLKSDTCVLRRFTSFHNYEYNRAVCYDYKHQETQPRINRGVGYIMRRKSEKKKGTH